MPDRRKHRGPHPDDARLFSIESWPALREAAADLCWLLSRGYAGKSALKLVGDRYDLVARQRTAVGRCSCACAAAARREEHRIGPEELAGRALWVDGYNVLTTVESGLAGGVVLAAGDGSYRDMASMHGSYRKVAETLPALRLLGRMTADLKIRSCLWYLDRPVSNSGRLKTLMEEVAAAEGLPWLVELVPDPDTLLADTKQIVASADSRVLDCCVPWFNLARETIVRHVPEAWVVDLSGSG